MVDVEKAREVLRLLERAGIEHLGWLMRVHCALMFPEGEMACDVLDDGVVAELCANPGEYSEELQRLALARAVMCGRARDVLAGATDGGAVDAEAYAGFMAAVDGYCREVRHLESLFHRQLAETDPLTGVRNRHGMMRGLRREWTRSLRTGRPVCLALADLDHFKQINDRWGHPAGDKALCHAVRCFVRRLRPYDLVYRYGGEEFIFCLPDTDCATARRVLERLIERMAREPVTLDDGTELIVTSSIGLAEMTPGRTVQEAIEAADRALYAAKAGGRNRVAVAPAAESAASPDVLRAGRRPLQGVNARAS